MPLATHEFTDLHAALEYLKRTRSELRTLRKVHVARDRFEVFDINGESFEITGVGYPRPEIVALLRAVNAAFDPQTVHAATELPYKELKTGRRHPWAEDRVM
jgi:hypothetical protein